VPSMEPGLNLLVEHGYLRRHPPTSTNIRGRPPSPGYAVNPLTVSQNSHNSQNSDTALAERFLVSKTDPSDELYSDVF
jgi:hypothetical protein